MNFKMIFDNLSNLLSFAMSDKFGFCLFEILFFLIFLYALWKDKISSCRGIISEITRGEESRNVFMVSASAFTTLVLSIIFTISSYPKEGRMVFYLINLGMVIYLFFYSRWFTNKLVGWWINFKQRKF
jgi:hypothetical protein